MCLPAVKTFFIFFLQFNKAISILQIRQKFRTSCLFWCNFPNILHLQCFPTVIEWQIRIVEINVNNVYFFKKFSISSSIPSKCLALLFLDTMKIISCFSKHQFPFLQYILSGFPVLQIKKFLYHFIVCLTKPSVTFVHRKSKFLCLLK